ncbi:uncharacterized protein LOC130988138 [Salvia miltiorrhiza]|uniref:uncharacterized protein LOC130988138 n=1 Tax=Salvia miltiorrhiza TaxID=226208 RepID=UPI0025ABFF66|nr:uncharacterized protein LOC130988138 [Salvia miltiorrhiza]
MNMNMATYDETAAGSGGGCSFRRFCCGGDEDEGHRSLLGEKEGGAEWWFVAKLKKLRELSEVVAGPKWKNLIRKMGRICNSRKQNKSAVESRYSPESYALNFSGDANEDDQELSHSFSTRFATGFAINDHQRRPGL